MRGMASDLATPLMISAIRIACSSLSMTHGPAIRKRSPDPTWMSPTWKEVVMPKPFHHLDEVEGNSRIPRCLSDAVAKILSPRDSLRPMKHLYLDGFFLGPPPLPILVRCSHKCPKQRMRLERLRLELGMELATDKMRMIRQFHHLHISPVGRRSRDSKTG